MKPKKYIQLDASAVHSMITDLSLMVGSMDRLGSTYSNRPLKLAVEQGLFFRKIEAHKLLSRMQEILSAAYKNQSDNADTVNLEEDTKVLPYWKPHMASFRMANSSSSSNAGARRNSKARP